MKLKSLFALATLTAAPAFAHIEPGLYRGLSDGAPCTVEVLSITFEGDFKHPLNERVKVSVNNQLPLTLSHLPKVDIAGNKIEHEKGILTGAIAESMGESGTLKTAVVLEMSHEAGASGPTQYTLMKELNGVTTTAVCSGLQKQ